MEINDLLIKPLITEKSMSEASKGVYLFIVNKKARKPEIKKTIEEQFKVKVISVRTLVIKGKTKLTGRLRRKIKTSDFKKAIIKLAKDQKIDLFETGK